MLCLALTDEFIPTQHVLDNTTLEPTRALRAAVQISKLWTNIDMLNVAVVGGTQREREWVQYVVDTYLQPYVGIKLRLTFMDDVEYQLQGKNYPIRVGLPGTLTKYINPNSSTPNKSHYGYEAWATIGTDALRIPFPQVTSYIGTLDLDTSGDISARGTGTTIVHEFLHIFGFIHEHQRIDAPINWNKKAVYDYYGEGTIYNWPTERIDNNLFKRLPKELVRVQGAYDPTSIMHYTFPRSFVNNYDELGLLPHPNTRLSQSDIHMLNNLREGFERSSFYDPLLSLYVYYDTIALLVSLGICVILLTIQRFYSIRTFVKTLIAAVFILYIIHITILVYDRISYNIVKKVLASKTSST